MVIRLLECACIFSSGHPQILPTRVVHEENNGISGSHQENRSVISPITSLIQSLRSLRIISNMTLGLKERFVNFSYLLSPRKDLPMKKVLKML